MDRASARTTGKARAFRGRGVVIDPAAHGRGIADSVIRGAGPDGYALAATRPAWSPGGGSR